MTNEQATELGEKVFPKDWDWDLIWSAFCDDNKNYTIEITQGPKMGFYEGDSWESAFLAAGVEVCGRCHGVGEEEPSGSEYPSASLGAKFRCGLCNGLGYRLTEGRKP